MTKLARFLIACMCLGLYLLSAPARADGPQFDAWSPSDPSACYTAPCHEYRGWSQLDMGGNPAQWGSWGRSKPSACATMRAAFVVYYTQRYNLSLSFQSYDDMKSGASDARCWITWTQSNTGSLLYSGYLGGEYRLGSVSSLTRLCPTNAGVNANNACQCNNGFVPSDRAQYTDTATQYQGTKACVPGIDQCSQKAGTSAGKWDYMYGSTRPSESTRYICNPTGTGYGCSVKLTPSTLVQYNGNWSGHGVGSYTGKSCDPNQDGNGTSEGSTDKAGTDTPESTAAGEPNQNSCPTGQIEGWLNTTRICYTPSKDTTTASVPTTNTTTVTTANGTETVETTESTECANGICTTTKTIKTTPAGGGAPTTRTETTNCAMGAPGCGVSLNPGGGGAGKGQGEGDDPSNFGGACASGFTCSGDAVQCAVAKASYEHKCLAAGVPAEVEAKAASVLNGDQAPAGLEVSLGSVSGPTAVTGSCNLPSFNVPVIGGQFVADLGIMCQHMDLIRTYIGIVGTLMFTFIAFKRG